MNSEHSVAERAFNLAFKNTVELMAAPEILNTVRAEDLWAARHKATSAIFLAADETLKPITWILDI